MTFSKNSKKTIYIKYTFIFLVVGLFVFSGMLISGKSLFWKEDSIRQYYPGIVYLRQLIKILVKEHRFEFWSWQIGLGEDVIAALYSMYMDPFSYIVALFPVKMIDLAYGFMVYVRLYIAGFGMLYFCRRRHYEDAKCILGAISYGFCGWALNVCFCHAFFLVPFILMPLLIEGVIRWNEERKWGLLYFSVVASFVTCIYFAWMSALIVMIYVIVYYMFKVNEKNIKNSLAYFVPLFVIVGGAAVTALPLFLPVFWGILQASKSSGMQEGLLFSISQYLQVIPSFITRGQFFTHYSTIFVNAFTFAMLPAIILKMKSKQEKSIQVTFLVCMLLALFPKTNAIFNGFSYAVGRWFYGLSFFFLWSALDVLNLEQFEDEHYCEQYQRILHILFLIEGLAVVAASVCMDLLPKTYILEAFVSIITAYFITGYICRRNSVDKYSKYKKVLNITCVSIAVTGMIIFNPFIDGSMDKLIDIGQCYEQYSNSKLEKMNYVKDNDFYRVLTDNTYLRNESLFAKKSTAMEFFSVINKHWIEYQKTIGNSVAYRSRVVTENDRERSRTNFLQGLKYAVYSGGKCYGFDKMDEKLFKEKAFSKWKKTNTDTAIYKNRFQTSMGYVYPSVLRETELMNYSGTECEEIMMQTAVVEDDYTGSVLECAKDDIVLGTREISYDMSCADGIGCEDGQIVVANTGSKITIMPEAVDDCELYVSFENLKRIPVSKAGKKASEYEKELTQLEKLRLIPTIIKYQEKDNFTFKVSMDGLVKSQEYASGNAQGITDNHDYLTCMGYYEKTGEDTPISLQFDMAGTYTYDALKLYAVDQKNFTSQAELLQNRRLQVTELKGDHVESVIDSDIDGLLYLSIPYNKGWKIYIDGERCEKVYRTNVGFTGIDISSGVHQVTMIYRPFGLKYTVFVSLFSIIVLVGIGVYTQKRNAV